MCTLSGLLNLRWGANNAHSDYFLKSKFNWMPESLKNILLWKLGCLAYNITDIETLLKIIDFEVIVCFRILFKIVVVVLGIELSPVCQLNCSLLTQHRSIRRAVFPRSATIVAYYRRSVPTLPPPITFKRSPVTSAFYTRKSMVSNKYWKFEHFCKLLNEGNLSFSRRYKQK